MQNNPDNFSEITSLLNTIQQRLATLENKVDILVNRVLPMKTAESKPVPVPIHKPAPVNPGNAGRQNNRNMGRPMFKAICADCKKECEVPFRPSGDRPVYCQECFARRKANNPMKPGIYLKPKEAAPAQIKHIEEKQAAVKEKPAAKEKIVAKKKPAANKKPAAKKKTASKTKVSKKNKKSK